MSGKRFEGKNLEEALENAARSFGVERFRVSYHVVLEKRGFLGGTKRVVIEAEVSDAPVAEVEDAPSKRKSKSQPKAARKEKKPKDDSRPSPRDQEPREERKPEAEREAAQEGEKRGRRRRGRRGRRRGGEGGGSSKPAERSSGSRERKPLEVVEPPPQGDRSEEAAMVAKWCEEIFELSGIDLVVRTTDTDEEIAVELYGPDTAMIDQGAGDFIDSLQVLANKAFTGRKIERRIEFDAAGFKQRREEELGARARDLAERVREEGRERTMRAMSPIERRIVHVTLESEEGVTTESRGRGFHKRVAIIPADDERAAAGES